MNNTDYDDDDFVITTIEPNWLRLRNFSLNHELRLCGICMKHKTRCYESSRGWRNFTKNWKVFRRTQWRIVDT